MYGPKSNIWDLFVISYYNNDFIFSHYNWENWFVKNQVHKYNLIQEYYISDIIFNNYDFNKICKLVNDNEKLLNLVKDSKFSDKALDSFNEYCNNNKLYNHHIISCKEFDNHIYIIDHSLDIRIINILDNTYCITHRDSLTNYELLRWYDKSIDLYSKKFSRI
jgi:hypothetical protein